MITNPKAIERFERCIAKATKPDVMKNLKILDAMYREARLLGAFRSKSPLDGIETDIKIAKIVNSV